MLFYVDDAFHVSEPDVAGFLVDVGNSGGIQFYLMISLIRPLDRRKNILVDYLTSYSQFLFPFPKDNVSNSNPGVLQSRTLYRKTPIFRLRNHSPRNPRRENNYLVLAYSRLARS